jgi:hypothetical protein
MKSRAGLARGFLFWILDLGLELQGSASNFNPAIVNPKSKI